MAGKGQLCRKSFNTTFGLTAKRLYISFRSRLCPSSRAGFGFLSVLNLSFLWMCTQSAFPFWGHVWSQETSSICPTHVPPDATTALQSPFPSPAVVSVVGGDGKSAETEPVRQNCRRRRFANYVFFLSVFPVTFRIHRFFLGPPPPFCAYKVSFMAEFSLR